MNDPIPESSHPTRVLSLLSRLEKSGLKRETAEVLIEAIDQNLEQNSATRKDLKETENRLQIELREVESRLQAEMWELENRLRTEMRELENRLRTEMLELESRLQIKIEVKIAETKSDLIKWMVGAMIAQTGIIIGILGFIIQLNSP